MRRKMMPAGRPPMFDTPEKMQVMINEYFSLLSVVNEEKDTNIHFDDTPTITGLAFFLGFSCRQSMYEYEQKADFTDTIKRARTRVENWYEKCLLTKGSTGSIFALKNLGWSDKQEVEASVSGDISMTWNVLPKNDSK